MPGHAGHVGLLRHPWSHLPRSSQLCLPPSLLLSAHLRPSGREGGPEAHHLQEAKCQGKLSLRGKAQGRRARKLGANSGVPDATEGPCGQLTGPRAPQRSSSLPSSTFWLVQEDSGPSACTEGWRVLWSCVLRDAPSAGTAGRLRQMCQCAVGLSPDLTVPWRPFPSSRWGARTPQFFLPNLP